MKKRNILMLTIVSILSFCAFTGLFVYAFWLQVQKDQSSPEIVQTNPDTVLADMDPESSVLPAPAADQAADPATADQPAADQSSADSVTTDSEETDSELVKNSDTMEEASATEDDSTSEEVDAGLDAVAQVNPNITLAKLPDSEGGNGDSIVLGFAGDVNFDEDSYPAAKYDAEGEDITGCFSEDLLEEMNSANVMMINNEFAYSTRGVEEENKSYTFRADPKRIEILQKMGVDIVSLANNHALDFGPEALSDTFATLDSAGIEYVGAGNNLDRAKAPIYYQVGDKVISYVAASRVVFDMSWYASEEGLGMVGTYDPGLIIESIREAEANSDFVVIFVHWGVERNSHPEDYQRNMAKLYIDAGADAVIGCHPHVMQGIEFYNGKPIAYSLGNYWFNKSEKESGMVKLYLDPDETVRVQLLPAMNKDTFTYLLTDPSKKESYYDFIEGLSYGIDIDEDGFISSVELE